MTRRDFKNHQKRSEKWYDLADDWDLIVASFATQYHLQETDIAMMEWRDFFTLLAGILPKTPLGMIVQIRAEEDKDILKYFTPEQRDIRNAWRSRRSAVDEMTDEEKQESISRLQEMFAKAFS